MKIILFGVFALLVLLSCPLGASLQSPALMAVYFFLAMPAGAAALKAIQLRNERR